MNKLIRGICLTLVLLGLTTGSAMAQGRIATVDLRKLFDSYWKTKQADAALKDRATDLDKEAKGLREDYKKATEEYQKLLADANDQAVSAEERDRRKKSAEAKLKSIKDTEETIVQFDRQANATLGEQKRRMRENLISEIRTTINGKAKSAGYAMVLDIAGDSINNTPVLLYNNGENDITDDILTQLNAGAPIDFGKSDKNDDKKPDDTKTDEKKSDGKK